MSLQIRSFSTLWNRCAKATVINFHQNNTRPRYGKCFSNQHPPRDTNSVMAAGLWAGNTRYNFVPAGVSPAVVRGRSSRHSVCYGDEYYFSTFVGWAHTNLTGRWWALFARYFWLRGCWPSGFLINITWLITKSGDWHWSGFGLGYGYSGKIRHKRKQRVCFIYKRISVGCRNGLGERATWHYFGKVHTARQLLVKRP